MRARTGFGITLACAASVHAQPSYQIHRLGYFDAAHTSASNAQQTTLSLNNRLTAAGQVIGYSNRYVGGTGHSAWVFDPVSGTRRLGSFDAEHTRADGFQDSVPVNQSADGWVIGHSSRFTGSSSMGSSAWLAGPGGGQARLGFVDALHTRFDGYRLSVVGFVQPGGASTGYSYHYTGAGQGQSAWYSSNTGDATRIGFHDAAHTSTSGISSSEPVEIRDDRVLGYSLRYLGAASGGRSAWAYTPAGGTVRLGFTGLGYERTDGYQHSDASRSNGLGQIAGTSNRYSGTTHLGQAAWVHTPGSPLDRVGLLTAEHTRADGFQDSWVSHALDSGLFLGRSLRYSAMNDRGQSAWTYRAGVGTTRIGLFDAGHTRPDGTQFSQVRFQSHDRVVGWSDRYPTASIGRSAWIYSAQTGTVRIGLIGPEYTGVGGVQHTDTRDLNSVGGVTGYSYLQGDFDLGWAAWAYAPQTGTTRIGLLDPQHTRADGVQVSAPDAINDAGQVVGTSHRYVGSTQSGESGFFYDPATGINHSLVFSVRPDGYASTFPQFLTPGGHVLGRYDLFSGSTALGERAFLWSLSGGFADLGSLVQGGLSAAGWTALQDILDHRDIAMLVGYGTVPVFGGRAAFALVPAPGSAALLGLALLVRPRRRRAALNSPDQGRPC